MEVNPILRSVRARYDGYTGCPVVTESGKVLMAEFGYDKKPAPTLPLPRCVQHLRKHTSTPKGTRPLRLRWVDFPEVSQIVRPAWCDGNWLVGLLDWNELPICAVASRTIVNAIERPVHARDM